MAGEDQIVRIENGLIVRRTVEDNLHSYTNNASAVAVGDVVAQDATVDDKVVLADADTASTAPPIGVVTSITDTTNCVVCHAGGIATGLSGLTKGSSYWLTTTGTSGNTLTSTQPSTNAYLVGVALSATSLLVTTVPADLTPGNPVDDVTIEINGSSEIALKAGGVAENFLGFSWATETIAASSFSFSPPRSTYILASSASSNANVLDMATLYKNGVNDQTRVTTTAAANQWSISGTTLSVHGDITSSGDTYKVTYIVGTAAGGTAAGKAIYDWHHRVEQDPLETETDYFNDSNLDSKWSEWDPQSALTITETTDGLVLTRSSNANEWNGLIQDLPTPTSFTITAEFDFETDFDTSSGIGIFVAEDLATNPTTDAIFLLNVQWDTVVGEITAYWQRWTNYTTNATIYSQHTLSSTETKFLLRLFVDTTAEEVTPLLSRDGNRWYTLDTPASTTGFTLDKIGIAIRNDAGDPIIGYSKMFRVDNTSDPTLPVGGLIAIGGRGGVVKGSFDTDVAIVANDTHTIKWFAPYDCTITGINLFAVIAPSSAAGTYLFDADASSNNLLSTTNFDLETLSNNTLTAMTLTSTSANLDLTKGDICTFDFTSNNADLTGEGLYLQVLYQER